MDRMLYVAMAGAKETLRAQTVNNHNLANVSTNGFKADLEAFQSRSVDGSGFASRVYAQSTPNGWDSTSGALLTTGRDLDIAVNGQGWITVQGADGKEAYTRAGDLQLDPTGALTTATGHPVLGDGGPVVVPPYSSILFGRDGSISIVAQGQTPETTSTIGRLKLVNPLKDQIVRGDDGLFRMKDGSEAPSDAAVQVSSGVLETSNVNAAEAMVNMIELARHFEMQVKAIRSAEENGAAAAQLMRLG
ncbi:MAG TPA: flagellar basal-body rod protein FlgF [Steroidobacteraceae bacterium]|jgi:flagellar basal-body rod protein FlgF|nr:flagellar basal-body rod protein FlgF [Steroidobacteraceae bacterium]